MIVVDHRRNSLEQLAQTAPEYGIEVDLRNHGSDIIVTHDPFVTEGVRIEQWLDAYRHAFLIANVKEEGLEERLLPMLRERGIADYFILDESFPYIRKYALQGVRNFALRVSEYEDHRTPIALADALRARNLGVDWIWVDSFTGEMLDPTIAAALRTAGFRLCYVSPELHHIPEPESWERRVRDAHEALDAPSMSASRPDMVCTKLPALWRHWTAQASGLQSD